MDDGRLVWSIWRSVEIRDGDGFFHPPALFEYFFESCEDVFSRTMKWDTGDTDSAGGREVDAFDRSTRSKFDDVPRRDFVTDHVELFFVKAMGPEEFVNLLHVVLGGGEET